MPVNKLNTFQQTVTMPTLSWPIPVLSVINDVQIIIYYCMRCFVDVWFVYNFIVEQLSLVQSYRNEYQAR